MRSGMRGQSSGSGEGGDGTYAPNSRLHLQRGGIDALGHPSGIRLPVNAPQRCYRPGVQRGARPAAAHA